MQTSARPFQALIGVSLEDRMKRLLSSVIDRVRPARNTSTASGAFFVSRESEVFTTHPAAGVTSEELLRVAAAGLCCSQDPAMKAVVQRTIALGLSGARAEDHRQLPSGGVHCWVDGIPTLIGSSDVVRRLGIAVGDWAPASCGQELFVAHGSQLLGCIQIGSVCGPEAW